MTALLTYLRILPLIFSGFLLIACHSSSSDPVSIPDINTFHIYTKVQTIYSFNEETGISTKRGEFDSGEQQFIELNLDEEKQGFEYAVYVYENSIYLLDYDKAKNAKTTKLATIASDRVVCRLIPQTGSSKFAFSDRSKSNRSELNLPIVFIEYQQPGYDCDPETNLRDELNFSSAVADPQKLTDIKKTLGNTEKVLGSIVVDYSSAAKEVENNLSRYDETGFLGHDLHGNRLVFNYSSNQETNQWEMSFYSSTGIQTIHQASSNHVLVQQDDDVYVVNAKALLNINKDVASTPVQEKIDILFEMPTYNFDSSFALEFNKSQNKDSFLVKHNNTLYFYSSPNFVQIPTNETIASQSATKLKFDLTSDNTALVIQESNNIQTLIAISASTGQSTTIISASKIDFTILGNEFFVNTFETESSSGWQAHWFTRINNSYIKKTYEQSRFIFSEDLREANNALYLLSSDDYSSNQVLKAPNLFIFDKTQTNGRKKGKTSANSYVDFNLGKLSTDVSDILSSKTINDIYATILLRGVNGDSGLGQAVEERYYFNPSQEKADPSFSEQSLTLMTRTAL